MSLFSFCPLYFKNDLYHTFINKMSFSAELSLFICVLVAIAVPYLLGSLNFGIIFSKLFYHDDIRNYGSGNAGSTNMLRTYGKGMAALTLAGDMIKGALALLVGALLLNPMAGTTIGGIYVTNTPIDGIAIAALFVILGHIFPCFYRFKGGKGVATFGMVILVTRPLIFAILFALFLIIVIGTRFVSLHHLCADVPHFAQPTGHKLPHGLVYSRFRHCCVFSDLYAPYQYKTPAGG